ncbi:4-hydroxybenzoate 3-monooxygenase [Trichosporon asahii var. asahii CBS 8904]|uniref:4-hydroxybenzoate 3-monooxygenase n=2 Tax=Trichosporon asahii var. asahii TaxID=189963 RepID=K1WM83_TRIAC|nr:4-hydroxybenzoate 3-monooxygenase [Trichosporon asahii var. asahii CBS 2479]EJT53028.1 4-hydroxybenzoate 3-monooxygenase [Trichosporon asahii var. asahii CBS 2479]EKD02234.1 4-hydroxybenzoate 3-monooxygenase [Trichosporon asahii var. asahii CBS 8904]
MVKETRTTVGIIGAGPAGLLLARLLFKAGIDSVVIESKDREYVEQRQRAGILEQGSVDALRECGAGERMDKEGIPHDGIELLFDKQRYPIHFPSLTGGRQVMIYAQTEVCKDLIALQLKEGGPLHFECEALAVEDPKTDNPKIRFRHKDGEEEILSCDYVVGCDGFWGVARKAIPESIATVYEKTYPFAWLGILADVPPSNDELIYARHPRGFSLLSMRSPTVSRYYIQVPAGEDIKEWSDERIWDEIEKRTETNDGWKVQRGPIFQKSVLPMRSYVHEPMQYGRVYLAGDAAHIVPPTGAKGLNLAFGDVVTLAKALKHKVDTGSDELLNNYSDRCIGRVWQAERFSYDMTNLLHTDPNASAFEDRLQVARLKRMVSNPHAETDLALAYTGFPL